MCILSGVAGVTRPNLFGSARLFGLLTRGSGDTIFFIIISGVAREKDSLGNCMGKEPSAGTQSTALSAPRAVGHISSIKKKCAAVIFSCLGVCGCELRARRRASSVKGLFSRVSKQTRNVTLDFSQSTLIPPQ